jgi:hypothetical protein
MAAVNLCLSQGTVARWERIVVARRATDLRTRFVGLLEHGFRVDDKLDLASSGALPKRYEEATVAYKVYEKNDMPVDQTVEADIAMLLSAYRHAVNE